MAQETQELMTALRRAMDDCRSSERKRADGLDSALVAARTQLAEAEERGHAWRTQCLAEQDAYDDMVDSLIEARDLLAVKLERAMGIIADLNVQLLEARKR